MLYYNQLTFGRRMRSRLVSTAGRGLRSHPLLAIALFALITVLAAAAVAAVVVLLVVLAALAAFAVACYAGGRELLRAYFRARDAQRHRPQIGVRVGAERYLASVDQFAQTLQTALGLGIHVRPGDRRLRRALQDGERLQASLRELARYWRGPSAITVGIYELEDATIALVLYLKQLTRAEAARPPAAVLRGQAEALGRRLDTIRYRLQQTDFRATFEAARA
jgi:hypothetical protein